MNSFRENIYFLETTVDFFACQHTKAIQVAANIPRERVSQCAGLKDPASHHG